MPDGPSFYRDLLWEFLREQVGPRGSSSANTMMRSPLFSSLPGVLPPDLGYGALRRPCLVAEPERSEVPAAVLKLSTDVKG